MEVEDIQHIGVVGAGLMGHGIALQFALGGYDVHLNDVSDDGLNRALENVKTTLGMLQDMGGVGVTGYRASNFSITKKSLWALDILAEEGFLYDSSIAPLRHDRYGIPDERRAPHVRELKGGQRIVEFPVSLMRILGWTFPLGGGFFRLFPLPWTSRALNRYDRRGSSAMIYVHPWEVDPDQPRATGVKLTHRIRHYARLKTTEPKLERLLARHSWCPMELALEDLLQAAATASS